MVRKPFLFVVGLTGLFRRQGWVVRMRGAAASNPREPSAPRCHGLGSLVILVVACGDPRASMPLR